MATQKTFRDLEPMIIIRGPGLRELDLACTDPYPNGNSRMLQFLMDKETSKIVPVINSTDIFGMMRRWRDPDGDLNTFIWSVCGKTKIHFGSPGAECEVIFVVDYSPLTRRGRIRFFDLDATIIFDPTMTEF